MPGRKPIPTQLKALKGTLRNHRVNNDAPKVSALIRSPGPPPWLAELAAEKWLELCPQLVKQKILTALDCHNLEGFCVAYYLARTAEREIRENGITVTTALGDLKKNPAVTVLNEANRDMRAYGSALGLDPASRSKLVIPREGNASSNPFGALG